MKLYKDGMEINAEKSQLPVMFDDGWSLTVEESPTSEEITEDIDEAIVEEKVSAKPKKRTSRVAKKIIKKE